MPFVLFGFAAFGFDGLLELGFLAFGLLFFFLAGAGVALCVEGFCGLPAPVGWGGFADGVVVVVVVEVVFGVVVVVVVLDEVDVVVVVVVVVVVEVVLGVVDEVVVDEHDSVTDSTGPVTGSLIDDSGVPGGTSTVKLDFWPVSIVTVTTQVSAEAVEGIEAPPTASAVMTATTSFRLLNIVARLLPTSGVRTFPCRHDSAVPSGRY